MLTLPVPATITGDLLAADLATVGLPTEVLLEVDTLCLPDLDEADRAAAQAVLDAHPAKAQAEIQRMAGERTNETTIRTQAETALANNRTFLAIASPTNAQLAAQVKALTRQNNGLIRLVLNRFDGTD